MNLELYWLEQDIRTLLRLRHIKKIRYYEYLEYYSYVHGKVLRCYLSEPNLDIALKKELIKLDKARTKYQIFYNVSEALIKKIEVKKSAV